MTSPFNTGSGGQIFVASLLAHGVENVFCVPGESYLAILDALYDVAGQIRVISCRHEAGAAIMAAATARMSGRAGVCLVTRGPGATNASIAVHIARQASIPLILAVGQVARANLGRESFQEVDYEALFTPLAKHVEQVNDTAMLADAINRAFHIAHSGRPGPVVLALPEDVLQECAQYSQQVRLNIELGDIRASELHALCASLARAERPLVLAGGGNWDDLAAAQLVEFAEKNRIPVCTSFRRHDLFDNDSECFAGYLGYGAHPEVWPLVNQADCVVVLGARLDEPTTQSYTILRQQSARELIHIYPSAREIGRNYAVDLAITADVRPVAAKLAALAPIHADWGAWCGQLRQTWVSAQHAPLPPAAVELGKVMMALNERLADDTIVTVDAGNFSRWPQRYRRYRRPGRLLAPINGAMGFGVPAAVGVALAYPERQVVGCVGDGGMLMTGMELATAARYGAKPLILVFNNASYGTIEMHQDQRYPGRKIATALANPDFAQLAHSFGLFGARVSQTADFAPVLEAALASDTAAVIELVIEGY